MAAAALDRARQAAAAVAAGLGGDAHDAAVVLGSGWAAAGDALGEPVAEVAMDSLPGFPPPGVPGHERSIRSVAVGPRRVLVLLGRVHLYEGHAPDTVVHGVRTAVLLGCRCVLLTNAAGSLQPSWPPGTAVAIADQLNLTGRSPLTGPEFLDVSDLYSARLRRALAAADPSVPSGVYAGMAGPQYETPAEVRMLRAVGADLVGMSTVLEALAAHHLGAEVLGLSLVTNLAAGLGGPLDHGEVLAEGRASAPRLGRLLREVLLRA